MVEQRDKWRREAEKTTKENDKLNRDLLRASKLTARRAPTATSATQATPPLPSHPIPSKVDTWKKEIERTNEGLKRGEEKNRSCKENL